MAVEKNGFVANPSSGSKKGIVNITAEQNDTGENKNVNFVIKNSNGSKQIIIIFNQNHIQRIISCSCVPNNKDVKFILDSDISTGIDVNINFKIIDDKNDETVLLKVYGYNDTHKEYDFPEILTEEQVNLQNWTWDVEFADNNTNELEIGGKTWSLNKQ